MASSIVCQQQSSLEPRFIEPRTFGLKLAPPKPLFIQSLEWAAVSVPTTSPTSLDSISNIEDHNNKNVVDDNETITNINSNVNNDNGGWDFIQALENSSKNYINEAKKEKETPYVHPLAKRYSSKLSEKSLELCTENLGCETGSDIGEYSDVYSNSSSDSEDGKSLTRDLPSFGRNSSNLINKKKKKKKVITNCGGNLPPPLTSISGSNCIQVRSHREGGRLVIKTVIVPSSRSCFKAERRDGRLLLHFVNNYDSNHHAFEQQEQEVEAEAEVEECEHDEAEECEHDEAEDEQEMDEAKECEHDEAEAEEDEQEMDEAKECEHDEAEAEEDEQEMDEAKEEEEDIFFGEDMDGNDWNGGGEMGIEKFQRPRRCKESGGRGKNGLLIWEPFWVAT